MRISSCSTIRKAHGYYWRQEFPEAEDFFYSCFFKFSYSVFPFKNNKKIYFNLHIGKTHRASFSKYLDYRMLYNFMNESAIIFMSKMRNELFWKPYCHCGCWAFQRFLLCGNDLSILSSEKNSSKIIIPTERIYRIALTRFFPFDMCSQRSGSSSNSRKLNVSKHFFYQHSSWGKKKKI